MRYNKSVVNLLPIKNQRTVAWEHRRRVLLVVLLFVIFSVVLLGLFLAPSLMVTWSAIKGYKEQLVATKTLVDLQRRQSGLGELTDLQTRAELLKEVLSQRSFTSILQDITPRIPNDISLLQVAYSAQGNEITVALKGVAETRNALISFGDALRSSALFSHVDVPVSSLARSTDIDFDVTLVLELNGDISEYFQGTSTVVQLPEVETGGPESPIQQEISSSSVETTL